MPLQMFRRHNRACTKQYNEYDRTKQDCRCPFHVEGKIGDRFIRQSLQTTTERAARKRLADAEERDSWDAPRPQQAATSITAAIEAKLAAAGDENKKPTVRKWEVLLRRQRTEDFVPGSCSPTLDEFCRDKGLRFLYEITPEHIREFRRTWKDGELAGRKKFERLRGFFKFCVDEEYLDRSPAAKVKQPHQKEQDAPTPPFSEKELAQLYAKLPEFVEQRRESARGPASDHLERFGVLVRVMEYSGLAIGDAVRLEKNQLRGDTIRKRRVKNGSLVPGVPIPPDLVKSLEALPLHAERYFFWSGTGDPNTACGNYRRTLRDLCEFAGVEDGHPHRLRNTFAKRLFEKGVGIETVAKYMGQKNIQITQRYYNEWIEEREDNAAARIREIWSKTPRLAIVASRRPAS
jgi:integrase/recombinase XerD